MPDRATIEAATPRCQAHMLKHNQPGVCDQFLKWKHDHMAWACPAHGFAGHKVIAEHEEANA